MSAALLIILAIIASGAFYLTEKSKSLNATQIAVFANNAGFQGDDLANAIAIALAESGGDPNAYNPETAAGNPAGKGSKGLWQINTNAHPDLDVNLYDPQTNANAAYQIYSKRGYSFRDWSTYQGGQYEAFLSDAQGAIGV